MTVSELEVGLVRTTLSINPSRPIPVPPDIHTNDYVTDLTDTVPFYPELTRPSTASLLSLNHK